MRPMQWRSIGVFFSMLALLLTLAVCTAWRGGQYLYALGEFRTIVVGATAIVLLYAYAIAVHRLLLWIAPLREGVIAAVEGQEFRYQVYTLTYLFLLNPLIRSRVIPIPVMRLIYLALGARLGADTYCAGTIFDPTFVTIGANTLVGEAALLVPHVIEGGAIAHYRIAIGDNVTIGAYTVVLAGATICSDVVVAANSVVAKNTCMPPGEIWGGTPARRLRAAASSGTS